MANLKDLIVTGSARVVGKIYGTVTKAIADSSGNNIESTYVKKSDYLGFNLFDTKTVDHTLTGTALTGWVLAGTLVTNTYTTAVSTIKSLYDAGTTKIMTTKVLLPTFNSNTQDDFVISSSNARTDIYGVFNGDYSQGNLLHSIGNFASAWLQIKYPYKCICSGYTIQADNAGSPEYPTAWEVQGSNDETTWTTIDTKTGQIFTTNESKTFSISSTAQYQYFRIQFTAGNASGELRYFHFEVSRYWFTYKLASDGRLIAPISEKTNVDNFNTYNNYCIPIYVWDATNNRFYLPYYADGKKIIRAWKNKTSWCRIYSDGWCEQGGALPSYGNWQISQISFFEEFIDTSYYVGLTSSWNGSGAAANLYYERKTTKSCDVICLSYNNASYGIGRWYACGYLKNPPQETNKTYYCVGNSVVTPASIDVVNILEALEQTNNKMETINSSFAQINASIESCMRLPNYSAAVGISIPYTAPSDGFVYGGVNGIDAGRYVYVNGKMVHGHCGYSGGKWVYSGSLFEVSKGDVVTCDYTSGNYYFYPMKG